MKDERLYHLECCLAQDPTNQEALAAYTETKWKTAQIKEPLAHVGRARKAARDYVGAADDAAAKEAWAKLGAHRRPAPAVRARGARAPLGARFRRARARR